MGHGHAAESGLHSTKRMGSPNVLRSLIFYIMYHLVRNYKERFGIHVNTQTVVTFLDIGTCTTYLRVYRLRIVHTQRRHNDSSGSTILVRIIVELQIGTAACCRSSTFVCTGQRLVRARVMLWCTSGLASMKQFALVPSDIVTAYFFICVQFFSRMFFFNQG